MPIGERDGARLPRLLNCRTAYFRSVCNAWLSEWERVAHAAQAPAARSRLFDLLWERRWGDKPYLHARAAIDAYLELACGIWEPFERVISLVRALELARKLRDPECTNRVISRVIDAAREAVADAGSKTGVVLRLLEALMRLPRDQQPTDLDELLDTAAVAYTEDPWVMEAVLDLQANRVSGDQAKTRELRLRKIEVWRDFAANSQGLLRLNHLERALELARNYGFSEIADQIRYEIQSTPLEELGLNRISTTIEIPTKEIEEYIERITSGTDWKDCLNRFVASGPLSGNYLKNLAVVEELMRKFPIQFLAQKVIVGPYNVPIRIVRAEDEHREIELSQYEVMSISVWAFIAADILDRIQEKHGTPKSRDLTEFFTTEIISEDIAERFGRALVLFWKKQPDEAAHILLPRIEAAIRELCRQLGLAIVREPVGDKPGGVRPLGDLVYALRGSLDNSWWRYLWNLLSNPMGLNLRNVILHGLTPRAERRHAAILIHAACFLRFLRVTRVGEQER